MNRALLAALAAVLIAGCDSNAPLDDTADAHAVTAASPALTRTAPHGDAPALQSLTVSDGSGASAIPSAPVAASPLAQASAKGNPKSKGGAGEVNSDDPNVAPMSAQSPGAQVVAASSGGEVTPMVDYPPCPDPNDPEAPPPPEYCEPSNPPPGGGGGTPPSEPDIVFGSRIVALYSTGGVSAESQTVAYDQNGDLKNIYYIHTRGQSYANYGLVFDVTAGGNNMAYAITQRYVPRPSNAGPTVYWQQIGTHTWQATANAPVVTGYSNDDEFF